MIKFARTAVILTGLVLHSIEACSTAIAVSVTNPGYSLVPRGTGFGSQTLWPITVDPDGTSSPGAAYSVTNTNSNAKLIRFNADGTSSTLSPNVGAVVGTAADMEIGFSSDIFANANGGIVRFNRSTGARTFFRTDATMSSDSAMAFDRASQLLYVQDHSPNFNLFALNAAGAATSIVSPGPVGLIGMDIDQNGILFGMDGGGGVFRIDPFAHSSTKILNLSSMIPDWVQFRSLAVMPDTDRLFFSMFATNARRLYSINPDGTGLALEAFGGPGPTNVAIGPSGNGSGINSVYFTDASGSLLELRGIPAVPGDANVDGLVDGADYTSWADHFLVTGQTWQNGDFNGDGLVDGADYTAWADHFAPLQLQVSAVPEPSTVGLFTVGCMVLLAIRLRAFLNVV